MIGLNILKRFNILINDTMFIICQLIVCERFTFNACVGEDVGRDGCVHARV